jgi:hypothetical protein
VSAAERTRLIREGVARASNRLDALEQRVALLDRLAFQLDEFERRLVALEQRPPPPLAGPELRRQRDEVILRARAQGHSLAAIANEVGLSKSTVSRICSSNGDPAPPRVRGRDNGSYRAHWSPARAAVAPGGNGRTVKIEGVTTGGERIAVYGSIRAYG